jgi:cyclopropane fatty-acyl-phospholipid synthase-like methyltransferase
MSGLRLSPKEIVASGYDRCARAYSAARASDPSPELALLAAKLRSPARILDIGCGAGLPVTAALARMGTVVGVDISSAQIDLARQNVPSAQLIHGDIMAQDFAASSFDAVVAFYALFHLPRAEHAELLARVSRWTAPGGYLLATLPLSDDPANIEPDFFGATMYWSQYETSWYRERLEQVGWRILHLGELGHGFKQHPDIQPERHPVVLAQLPTPYGPGGSTAEDITCGSF